MIKTPFERQCVPKVLRMRLAMLVVLSVALGPSLQGEATTVTFPATLERGFLISRFEVERLGALSFIWDTGSNVSLIDQAQVAATEPSGSYLDTSLKSGPVSIDGRLLVTDLSVLRQFGVAGIIGTDVMQGAVWCLDYVKSEVRRVPSLPDGGVTVELHIENGLPIVPVIIGAIPSTALLDSGMNGALAFPGQDRVAPGSKYKYAGQGAIQIDQVSRPSRAVPLATVRTLGLDFGSIVVDSTAAPDRPYDMMLGAGLFEYGTLYIDFSSSLATFRSSRAPVLQRTVLPFGVALDGHRWRIVRLLEPVPANPFRFGDELVSIQGFEIRAYSDIIATTQMTGPHTFAVIRGGEQLEIVWSLANE